MKYDLIIWDFNGTIVNDVQLCYEILNVMLIDEGLNPVPLQHYLDYFGFPVLDYYKIVGFDLSKDNFHKLSVKFVDLYKKGADNCSLFPHIKESLQEIQNANIPQIVLSASEINRLNYQLNYYGIKDYFSAILGLTNDYAASKEEIGLEWLKQHNYIGKKVLFIGDTLHDAKIAEALKAKCVLVSYGHNSRKQLETKQYPIIDSITEIFNIIKK